MTSLESSDLQRIFKKFMIFLTFYLFPDLSCEKIEFSHQKLSFWTFDTFKTKVFDFQTSISRNHASRVLHSRLPPFGFVLKPVWSFHMHFHRVMADSCQKSVVKTSISRNYTYRVLHSRFPPFGIVLKPVWSVHMLLREVWRTSGRLRPWRTSYLLYCIFFDSWQSNSFSAEAWK